MNPYSQWGSVATSTPQQEKIPGREAEQVWNNAGGATFQLDKWGVLSRFLILGTEGGSYYASPQKMTKDAARQVLACIQEDGITVVNKAANVSVQNRAPKNDPALFVLALAASFGDDKTRKYALTQMPNVARIGTHLFHFAEYVDSMRGWGRGLRSAVRDWYLNQDPDKLANQLTKYQQRDGWSHRDLIRLSHPKTGNKQLDGLLRWAVKGREKDRELPHKLIMAHERAKEAGNVGEIVSLITQEGLQRESIPTIWLKEPRVWEALLPNMGLTALLRNLGNLGKAGIVQPLSAHSRVVADRILDQEQLKRQRVHPMQVLLALKVYGQGCGERGNGSWTPDPKILEALEEAFELAFGSVESSGKRTLLGLDVSGSMTTGGVCGISSFTAREAVAAMAMVTARKEPEWFAMAFSNGFIKLPLTTKDSFRDVIKKTSGLPFQGTDCAVPMVWALQNKIEVDTFIIYTDNETWAGRIHPTQALKQYRQKMGIPARLAVVGVTATNFTIADPKDPGQLDVVGFDTAAPQLLSDFSAGRF